MKRVDEYIDLYNQARQVYESPYLDWQVKYNFIFSKDISDRMHELFFMDYYDPDTSYEEDVSAWFSAATEMYNAAKEMR